jgi:hypothetical protein
MPQSLSWKQLRFTTRSRRSKRPTPTWTTIFLGVDGARDLLAAYARTEKLAGFGKTVLTRRLADATEVARMTGTSIGKAKTTVETGAALGDADDVRTAFQDGAISLD